MRNFLTYRHKKYWKERKVDWEKSYWIDHPHRDLIVKALKNIKFNSVIEIGCGAGYNLHKIRQTFPKVEIGGTDINEQAIETAKRLLPLDTAVLEQSPADKPFLSDKSVDVVLTDMCLIYIDPFNIGKTLKAIKKIGRNNVLFLEFHSQSWWKRLEFRFKTGYNAYNYFKLLKKYGFYDIEILRLSHNDWPDDKSLSEFRYLVSAKI